MTAVQDRAWPFNEDGTHEDPPLFATTRAIVGRSLILLLLWGLTPSASWLA